MPSRGPDTNVTNLGVNSLLLRWTTIPSEDAHGIVVGYRIYYRPYYNNQNFTVVQTNASTFNIKLDNLQEATLYVIMVAGLTSKGEGRQRSLNVSTCKYSLSVSVSMSLSFSLSVSVFSLSLVTVSVFVFVSRNYCTFVVKRYTSGSLLYRLI